MTLNPLHKKEQFGAIKYQVATAPQIQKQLKEKFKKHLLKSFIDKE